MIYLIITTCIHNKFGSTDSEKRKQHYLNSIKQTLSLLPSNIKPIIVENNGLRQTYLDSFNIPVLYTNNNKNNYSNKGLHP